MKKINVLSHRKDTKQQSYEQLLKGSIAVMVIALGVLGWHAYYNYWQEWDEQRAQGLLAALNVAEDQNAAIGLFKTLMGQQPEWQHQRLLIGFELRALLAYKAYWQRRAEKLLKSANTQFSDFNTQLKESPAMIKAQAAYLRYDQALIYGFAAAVKMNSAIAQVISTAYFAHQYDVLQLTLRGHEGQVLDASFSADGQRLASVGLEDNNAIIWDAYTGKPQLTLPGQPNVFGAVGFSDDGSKVVTGGYNKIVSIWDLATGEKISKLSGHTDRIYAVALSSNGKFVAAGAKDKTVRIWSLDTGKILYVLPVSDTEYQVHFTSNNQQVIAVTAQATVAWSLDSGSQLWTLPGFAYALSIAKSQNKLIKAGDAKYHASITINAVNNAKKINTFNVDEDRRGVIVMLALIQNDKQFVVASWRNYIQIRSVKTGKQLHFLDLSYLPERGVKRANISFDEKRIVTAQKDGTARVWDMDILRNRKQNPFENQTPQQLWLKVQQQLGLTLDENDQVVPLYPGGPRELIGWTGELKLLLHQESEKGPQ